jgi:peptidyl-tRNA hydrolase, PTH1 family
MSAPCRLIVGLGNPGEEYAQTRHNLGFLVVQAFAKKQGWAFKREKEVQGRVAKGTVGEIPVELLLPSTYMNLSGNAVRKKMRQSQAELEHLLIVVDDIYLPFGKMRLRQEGGTGGHKGLRSIEEQLQTQGYARLRMGIGLNSLEEATDLEAYVLSPFHQEEQEQLPQFLEQGVKVLECWLQEGIEAAIKFVGEIR